MKKALLIGINYIKNPDITLRGCIDDVTNMQSVLTSAYGYDKSNIITLSDDLTDPSKQPTRANIMGYLRLLAAQSSQLSEIWIHYSGHGSQIQGKTSSGKIKIDDVIVPCDYDTMGIIMDDELYAIVQRINCTAMFLIDSCHSGTMCELPWSYVFDNPMQCLRTHNLSGNCKEVINPNIYMFSGCKDSQTSADTYSTVLQESVGAFTNAFITCLQRTNYQRPILMLYRDICMYLSNSGYEQTPVLSCSSMLPKYVFTKVNAVPKKSPITSISMMVPLKPAIHKTLIFHKN